MSGALSKWKASSRLFFCANVNGVLPVELQNCGRSTTAWRHTDNVQPFQTEVVPPFIASRIKNRSLRSCFRIRYGNPVGFPQRARNARQRQIFQSRWTTGGLRNNVVNVEHCLLSNLGNTAVFATVGGARDNDLAKVFRNRHEFRRRGSGVLSASEGARANRSARQDLRLRGARRPSISDRSPVYPTGHEDGVQPPSGGARLSCPPAFPIQIEWSGTYLRPQFNSKPRPLSSFS